MIEVTSLVHRNHPLGSDWLTQQIKLNLRVHHDAEARVSRAFDDALKDAARVGRGVTTVRHEHVAEHARHRILVRTPRQQLEGRSVGHQEHVGLEHSRKALDG